MKTRLPFLILIQLGLFLSVRAQTFTRLQAQELRHQIRDTLFIPEQLPPLKAETRSRFRPTPGVVAERITYNTLFGLKVPAILYLPDPLPAGKLPGLVVVNGSGGDKYSWYAFYTGLLYAKAGAAVLTYDQIGEGERNIDRKSGTRTNATIQSPPKLARVLSGLMTTDVLQAAAYLSQRPEIDSDRIGAVGYSMGSLVLAFAGAADTTIRSVVLVGGGNLDGLDGMWDNSKPMPQGLPYQSLSFLGDRPAVIYALHAERGPTFIYNGLQDGKGTPSFFEDLHRRTARLMGSAEKVFSYEFTEGGHRPNFVTKRVARWLENQLDFPNWTEKSISAMPVTHISQWASENKVAMDPYHSHELGEGGTLALGSGIPGIPRSDLHVYSEEQWEKEKNKLIYEGWLKAARKKLREEKKGKPSGMASPEVN